MINTILKRMRGVWTRKQYSGAGYSERHHSQLTQSHVDTTPFLGAGLLKILQEYAVEKISLPRT